MAERGWPDNRDPTAEEWIIWYSKMGAAERRQVVEQVIASGTAAWKCQIMNHEGEIHQMQETINRLTQENTRLRGQEGMKRKW